MKKTFSYIVFVIAIVSCVACGKNKLDESSLSKTGETISVVETKNNGDSARMTIHCLNQKCENLNGDFLIISSYGIQNSFLLLESNLCIDNLTKLYALRGTPACLAWEFSDTLSDNIFYNEEKTFSLNNIDSLVEDSFDGSFTFAFSIKNIDEIDFPLYFRFFVVEKGCTDSIFAIG